MPIGVLVLVVTESVAEVVAGFGVKLPLAPAGNPLTANVTWPANPLIGVIVAVYVVVSAILSNPRNALLGALLIALGVPAFLFWRRQRQIVQRGTA